MIASGHLLELIQTHSEALPRRALPVFVVLLAVTHSMSAISTQTWTSKRRITILLNALFTVAVLFLLASIVALSGILFSGEFLDHCEPTIASIASYLIRGEAVYPEVGAAEKYGLVYGPYLFLAIASFAKAFGPSIFAAKLPGYCASFASSALLFIALRAQVRTKVAIICTGLSCMCVLCFFCSFTLARPDAFLLLCVTAGLASLRLKDPYRALVLGVTVGAATDVKLHAAIYFLPILAIAWKSGPVARFIVLFVATSFCTVAMPFLLFPNISLGNFAALLSVASKHGFSAGMLSYVLQTAALVGMPVLLLTLLGCRLNGTSLAASVRAECTPIAALLASFIIASIPASKLGAGPYHLIPLIPVVFFIFAKITGAFSREDWEAAAQSRWAWKIACAWTAAMGLMALVRLIGIFPQAFGRHEIAGRLESEVKAIVFSERDRTLLMAPGEKDADPRYFRRCDLVFLGQPIGLDAAAYMDAKRGESDEASLNEIVRAVEAKTGREVEWVVPKGAKPFSCLTVYPPMDNLFSENFRRAFAETFVKTGHSDNFDFYAKPQSTDAGRAH